MRLHNALLRGFYMAPSGKAAEAVEEDEGELTDDEVSEAAGKEGEEAPADEGQPEQESEAAPEITSYKDYFAKAGLKDVPDDPAQFASRYQQMAQSAQEAANLRQMTQWLQVQLAQAAQPKPEPPKPAERKKLWEIPQFDPALKQGLMLDENGQVVVKPGYDPSLPQQYQKYQAAVEQAQVQSLQMLSDPHAFVEQHIQPALAPFIQQQAMQIAQQQMAEYQERTEIQRFEQENRDWVYQADGVTLSPLAQQWNQHYGYAKQIGFPNAVAYATKMIDAELFSHYAAQQANPQPTEAEKKMALLNSGRRSPNRGGSFPNRHKKGPPQNKSDLWAGLRNKLEDLPKEDFEEL